MSIILLQEMAEVQLFRFTAGWDLRSARARLNTTSAPAATALSRRADIRNWIVNNPPGTTLAVRVNPSDPNDLVVETELPVRQFGTPREAWLTALAFGGAGALLFMAGRKLARSGR